MADSKHVLESRKGTSNWRDYRLSQPNEFIPDLAGADLREAKLAGADLREAKLAEAILSGANLQGADLRGANLQGAKLAGARMDRAKLAGANLAGANLAGAILSGVNLERVDLDRADLRRAKLRRTKLRGARLDGAKLEGAKLEGANLNGAKLSGANLVETALEEADLGGADLSSAHLQGADLNGANLNGADLGGADLSSANLQGADLNGANLNGANLEKANLRRARLHRTKSGRTKGHPHSLPLGWNLVAGWLIGPTANLGGADLIGADLIEANLRGADLGGADLRGADLRRGNLSGANLVGADLGGADLRGADLIGANLDGANLVGAKHGDQTRWPEGFDPGVHNVGADSRPEVGRPSERSLVLGRDDPPDEKQQTVGPEAERLLAAADRLAGEGAWAGSAEEHDVDETRRTLRDELFPSVSRSPDWTMVERLVSRLGHHVLAVRAMANSAAQTALADDQFSGQGFVREFEELITEDDALLLWRESEPLRGAVQYLLQSDNDAVTDEIRDRMHGHLRRLEEELNTMGGALGGSVRSYWLSLSDFVTKYTIRPVLADTSEAAVAPIRQVLDSLESVRADTQDPDAIGPALDAVTELAAMNPDVDPAQAKDGVTDAVGLHSSLDGSGDEGISDNRYRWLAGVISGAVGGALAGVVSSNPIIAAITAIATAIVVMARHSYRISRRERATEDAP